MATYERRIDALGGTPVEGATKYDEGYHEGHSDALTGAMEIASEADDTINELLDCIGELLNGDFTSIQRWGESATVLVDRVGRRMAA